MQIGILLYQLGLMDRQELLVLLCDAIERSPPSYTSQLCDSDNDSNEKHLWALWRSLATLAGPLKNKIKQDAPLKASSELSTYTSDNQINNLNSLEGNRNDKSNIKNKSFGFNWDSITTVLENDRRIDSSQNRSIKNIYHIDHDLEAYRSLISIIVDIFVRHIVPSTRIKVHYYDSITFSIIFSFCQ
jgi:hypothetical protein